MNFYYVDITVKVMADTPEAAEVIAASAAIRMEADYAGQIAVKGVEVEA